MQAELLALRLVHILGGILWVGSGLFTTFFLIPTLAKVGPQVAGQVMGGLQARKLFIILPINAVLVILTGARLMHIASGGSADYFRSPMGRTYLWAGVAALVAFLLSVLVSRPAAIRLAKLSQAVASDGASRERLAAEIRALQQRATMSGMVAVVLVVLSAAGMAVARYM